MIMYLRSSCARAVRAVSLAGPLAAAALTPALGGEARPAAAGERRVALVIGNNAYRETPLRNAVNDADAVAGALRDVGFVVTRLTDVDFPRFERAIADFSSQLHPGDVALFYFSGHGMQV